MRRSFPHLLVVAALALAAATQAADYYPRRRTCCGYAFGQDDSSPCQSSDACVLRFPSSGDLVSPETLSNASSQEFCRVDLDSKRYPEAEGSSRLDCVAFFRNRDLSRGRGPPPFSIKPYAFQGEGLARTVPGLNLEVGQEVLERGNLRGRILDTALCPSAEESETLDEGSLYDMYPDCKPRCFATSQRILPREEAAKAVLSFDCEVGFFIKEKQVEVTSNHTYQIDLCYGDADEEDLTCYSEYFLMPDMETLPQVLPLLDREALEDDTVNVWFDFVTNSEAPKTLSIYHRESVDAEWGILKSGAVEPTKPASLTLSDLDLDSGLYRVTLALSSNAADEIIVAEFQKSPSDGVATKLVLFLSVVVLVAVTLAYCYKRYYVVKASSVVVPNRLVEAERIQAKDVFIITNVDNKHHIDVVNAFGQYLKVGTLAPFLVFWHHK